MAKVIGVGGVFFKSNDPNKLAAWYQNVLGIQMGQYGASFKHQGLGEGSYTAFSIFNSDTEYFAPSQQEYLINFMVDDLFSMLLQVQKGGGTLVGKPEEYDYGKFGWFLDPDGNKIELWQPIEK